MRSPDRRTVRPARPWPATTTSLVLAAILVALGASPPQVVRVRVPSDKVASWFPPGSDLRILPTDRFEELLKAIRDRPQPVVTSRVLRAKHSARWDSGMLVGRSAFAVEANAGQGDQLITIEPWSPAIDAGGEQSKYLRALADGRLALKVDASSPASLEVSWSLRSRPGSAGRAFALALPELDLSSLKLDLPVGVVPETGQGPRFGPEPGPTPDRALWRFEGVRGRIDLKLRVPSEDALSGRRPSLWLEGPTRIDLNLSPANWQADWTLDDSPGAPRTLMIELDPGLELVDVLGPRVASYRIESSGQASRLTIRLDGEGPGSFPLTIRGICHPPSEGSWALPSARPIDAIWTGGKTTVRLDESRLLQSCREITGRRVPAKAGEPADVPTLIFEPGPQAGTVAELTFRKPTADATVEVRGHLILGDDIPRMEVALTWVVERGRLLSHAVDIPPGWTPDRVLSSVRQPIAWHAESLSNGGTRIHFGPSLPDEEARSLTLTLAASARHSGVTGPLELPRVRPAPGVRVVDEIWAATPDPNLILRPILGRGLAWIDPPDPPLDDIPTPWVADDLRNALAWRWLVDDAEARVDRSPLVAQPRGEINLEASIISDRLKLDWSISVEKLRGDLSLVPIHLDAPVEKPIRWRTRQAEGPAIEARPMDPARRATLGFPITGSAWDLVLSAPSRGSLQLQGRCEQLWHGRGPIPILKMPDRFRTRGLVSVMVEDTTRVKFVPKDLTPIDPSKSARRQVGKDQPTGIEPRSRVGRAALYSYGPVGGSLNVETDRGQAESRGGVVQEAFLVSQVNPGIGGRHRLSLRIQADSIRSMELTMPRGVAIDRIRRDGQAFSPIRAGEAFRVEIPESVVARPSFYLTIDYRTEDESRSGRLELARLLPRCSMPCLSFSWELVAPRPWTLLEASGIMTTDPQSTPSIASQLLGLQWSPWGRSDGQASTAAGEAMLVDLDKSAAASVDVETNLGEWLVKLDAKRWPLVVDRLALRSAGWGPNSKVNPVPVEARTLGALKSILEPMGLVACPLGGMILITGRDDAPDVLEKKQDWSRKLKDVPATGSDQADRFQLPARWMGEPTPRALSAGESVDRPPGPGVWHTWRLVSAGWPAPEASATLLDERSDRAWGWLIASVVLAVGILVRNAPDKVRAITLVVMAMLCSGLMAWTWPEPSTWICGLFRGVLALASFWIGRSFRPRFGRPPAVWSDGPTTSRRSGLAVGVGGGSLWLVACGLVSMGTAADSEPEKPILALLVFDGAPDPIAKPERVILLLEDYERLRKLAHPDKLDRPVSVAISAANHRIKYQEPGLAVVESQFEVDVTGDGPASWTLPVGQARDLSATIDARPSPLMISEDGQRATINVGGQGSHSLAVRRSVPLSTTGQGSERLLLPVNRAPFARFAVVKGEGTSGVEIPGASGLFEVLPTGIEGGLEPVEILEVHWSPKNLPTAASFRGSVEATFLWDARPSGDLIRARISHSDPEGASTVRLALEPGLLVRRFSIPNVVDVRFEGTAERPEWVARVDPPWPREMPVEVDLWRVGASGASERRWPAIEIVTQGRFSGILGFRRPSDWSGRLDTPMGIEAISESLFAKAWGPFEDNGLTLAGAVRLGQSQLLEVSTRPLPNRRSIRPKVIVDLAPGRLNIVYEAILSDRQGRSFELELGVPPELHLVRVVAGGLLDWQKMARDRLRLQFDGSEWPERQIRIEGYLSVPGDSVMNEARSYQTRIPWPRWYDAETSPGTLVISGPGRFQIDPGEGVTALPAQRAERSGCLVSLVLSGRSADGPFSGPLVLAPCAGRSVGPQ